VVVDAVTSIYKNWDRDKFGYRCGFIYWEKKITFWGCGWILVFNMGL